MPTDNVEIHGGSTGTGQVGQIVSYTLFYSGGTHINQEGPSNQAPGTNFASMGMHRPGDAVQPIASA